MEGARKTKRSERLVSHSPQVVAVLRAHRKRQKFNQFDPGHYPDAGLVFTMPDSRPIEPRTFLRRLEEGAATAGVRRIRVHDLRHTADTLMLQAGEHPRVVSDRLGATSVALTLDLYTHLSQDMQIAAAQRLSAFMEASDR
jgi:integrase